MITGTYIPEYADEQIEISYHADAYRCTVTAVYINDIKINGLEVSDWLYDVLMLNQKNEWVKEIWEKVEIELRNHAEYVAEARFASRLDGAA